MVFRWQVVSERPAPLEGVDVASGSGIVYGCAAFAGPGRYVVVGGEGYGETPENLMKPDVAVYRTDALLLARLEKLDGSGYQYDFSECMHYPLDEYIVSLGDLAAAEDAEAEAALVAEDAAAEEEAAQFDWRP